VGAEFSLLLEGLELIELMYLEQDKYLEGREFNGV